MSPGDPSSSLERIPGVLAATVFLDTPARPRVYVAHGSDVDTTALRNVILGLLRDHGYHTESDHVHLAVAPLRPQAPEGVLPQAALDDVEVHRSEHRVECTVRLRSGDRTTRGTAVEPDTPAGRARAAARATLQAAEALDPDYRFGLEGVRTLDLFGQPGLILLVDAGAGRAQARLPGTALLDRSTEEAAARATLQALRSWRG